MLAYCRLKKILDMIGSNNLIQNKSPKKLFLPKVEKLCYKQINCSNLFTSSIDNKIYNESNCNSKNRFFRMHTVPSNIHNLIWIILSLKHLNLTDHNLDAKLTIINIEDKLSNIYENRWVSLHPESLTSKWLNKLPHPAPHTRLPKMNFKSVNTLSLTF